MVIKMAVRVFVGLTVLYHDNLYRGMQKATTKAYVSLREEQHKWMLLKVIHHNETIKQFLKHFVCTLLEVSIRLVGIVRE